MQATTILDAISYDVDEDLYYKVLRIKPGYFRLLSDFELDVTRDGKTVKETGTTLHEIVLFKPAQREKEPA